MPWNSYKSMSGRLHLKGCLAIHWSPWVDRCIPRDALKFVQVHEWMGASQGMPWNLLKSSSGRIQGNLKGYLEINTSPWVDGCKEISKDTLKFIQVHEWTDASQGMPWSLYNSLSGWMQEVPKDTLKFYTSPHVDGYIPRDNLKFIQVLERTGKTQGMI